jgi:hypothetical protein
VYNLYLAGEDRVYMISLLGILTNIFAAISTRLGAAIASMNMLAMQLMFLVSFIGRLTMYIIARKLIAEI